MDSFSILKPDDMHLHLRQGKPLSDYVAAGCPDFARGVVMPNTVPPVTTAGELASYKELISEVLSELSYSFEPRMVFQVTPSQSGEDLRFLKENGAVAGKYYPAGVTTNSENGIASVEPMFPLFAEMVKLDIPLLIHGELPGAPVFERERKFLPTLGEISSAFPGLRVVLEHLSTKEGVEYVASLPANIASTVTVHHLLFTLEDMLANGIVSRLYCKPLLQSEGDRKAIREWVFSGSPKVFFGSDSAPHPRADKECSSGKAGVFSAPVAMPALAGLFEREGKLDLLENFVSVNGSLFYRWERNSKRLKFIREPWVVPEEYAGVVPMLAGERLEWKCESE